ncbi:MAG TPA: hypothetical protein VN667_22080 [Burkholderiales bacterium]|nr:hypothetical protein [Burkholderiales bacterium]
MQKNYLSEQPLRGMVMNEFAAREVVNRLNARLTLGLFLHDGHDWDFEFTIFPNTDFLRMVGASAIKAVRQRFNAACA